MIDRNWKPVVGYEGLYEVSSDGLIRSLREKTRIADKESRIMRYKDDGRGYNRVNLNLGKKSKGWLVSRVVALAHIPNPCNLPFVGHDDDNKKNNVVSNLYWTDARENLMHNDLHLKIAAKRNIQPVIDALSIPVVAVPISGGAVLHFSSMQEARRVGFDHSRISDCVYGKRRKHKGYRWERKEDYNVNS